jgi:transposase
VESAKRQDLYSTNRQGASTRAEEAHEDPDPRFYSRECKREAVRLRETSEKTVAQIARDLGVPERVLARGRHELREQQEQQEQPEQPEQPEQAFPGKGHQSEREEENRRLKRERDLLQQEREILKKAGVIFSRSQP